MINGKPLLGWKEQRGYHKSDVARFITWVAEAPEGELKITFDKDQRKRMIRLGHDILRIDRLPYSDTIVERSQILAESLI